MDRDKHSKFRTSGRVAWRLLLPFAAIGSTIKLAKKEAQRTAESLGALKDLGNEARKTLAEGIKGKGNGRNDSFEDAMANRSSDALSHKELYLFFLRKKRVALGAAAFFLLLGTYAIFGGIWYGHGRGIILGFISILSSQPVFFLVALSAHLRLWQLQTHRLSKEEQGGLRDFMRDVKGWWWRVLDPEFGRKGRANP